MLNLNKPAKELLVDLINQTSRRVNSSWQDIAYNEIAVGIPYAQTRTAEHSYRNAYVNVYDAADLQRETPYRLDYDRIDLLDLTRRYEEDLTLYLPPETTSVYPADILAALNAAAGTRIIDDDLVNTPFSITEFPIVMTVNASDESLIYCGSGDVRISTPVEPVQNVYIGEMSALGVSLYGDLADIATLPPGMGYVQSFCTPAFGRVREYVEYYSGPGSTVERTRLYSRYATLSQPLNVEALSTVSLQPNSLRNFTTNQNDFLNKVLQIDEELCLITAVNLGGSGSIESFTVKRGLGDTIPVQHVVGSKVYLLRPEETTGITPVTRATNVNVKLLAKIGPDVEEHGAVEFSSIDYQNRLARPQPPRNVQINGRWDSQIQGNDREYIVTWQHHPRFNADGDRVVDLNGWYDTTSYSNTDPGVEYQVVVKIASGGTVIFTSPRTASDTLTFTMPAFDGDVIVEVQSLIASLVCLQKPSVRFSTIEL